MAIGPHTAPQRPLSMSSHSGPRQAPCSGAAFPSAKWVSDTEGLCQPLACPPHSSPEHCSPVHASGFCPLPTPFHVLDSNLCPHDHFGHSNSHYSWESPFPSSSSPRQPLTHFLALGICLFWTFHTNGFIHSVAFCVWLLSPSFRVSRSITIASVSASLLFMAE